jgi:hypothetical protein
MVTHSGATHPKSMAQKTNRFFNNFLSDSQTVGQLR